MVQVEGELFSDALLWIDGKQAGKLTKTVIKTDGQLFIDDKYTVTLPPDHKDIPSEDQCTGTLDSLEMKPGICHPPPDRGGEVICRSTPSLFRLNAISYDSGQQVLKLKQRKNEGRAGNDSDVAVTVNSKKNDCSLFTIF